jgi:hypothetical protein
MFKASCNGPVHMIADRTLRGRSIVLFVFAGQVERVERLDRRDGVFVD